MPKIDKNNNNWSNSITIYLFNRRFLRKLSYYYMDFPRMFRCEAKFHGNQCGLYVKYNRDVLNTYIILCQDHQRKPRKSNNFEIPKYIERIPFKLCTTKMRLKNSRGIIKDRTFSNIANKIRRIKDKNSSFRWYLKQTKEYEQTMDENIDTNTKILRLLELNCHIMQYIDDRFNKIDTKIADLENKLVKINSYIKQRPF
jgi:hypothetical protein